MGGPNPHGWVKPDLLVHLAKELERAAFDYVMIEDSCNVPYPTRIRTRPICGWRLNSPEFDPAVLAPFMIQAASRIGIITTLSTTEYNPFLLARLTNALDHVSDGRAGWNLVTGSNDGGRARGSGTNGNFHTTSATTWQTNLWRWCRSSGDSWDADAMVIDQENEIFADPAKVRPVFHEGEYFRSRGPLSAPRSPGDPAICQAGGSPRGRLSSRAGRIRSLPGPAAWRG